jgi:hypothetical protein
MRETFSLMKKISGGNPVDLESRERHRGRRGRGRIATGGRVEDPSADLLCAIARGVVGDMATITIRDELRGQSGPRRIRAEEHLPHASMPEDHS